MPRSVLTTGIGTTSAGLTVSAVKVREGEEGKCSIAWSILVLTESAVKVGEEGEERNFCQYQWYEGEEGEEGEEGIDYSRNVGMKLVSISVFLIAF